MAYIQRERNAVGRAALRRAPSRARLNHLFWLARHRAEARVSHRETRLLAEHTPAHRHAQRASYKNIRVSRSLADGCYHGDAVTNRERVRASELAYINERGNLAEFNQSRRQQSSFRPAQVDFLCATALLDCLLEKHRGMKLCF